jgi:hypothetical protein
MKEKEFKAKVFPILLQEFLKKLFWCFLQLVKDLDKQTNLKNQVFEQIRGFAQTKLDEYFLYFFSNEKHFHLEKAKECVSLYVDQLTRENQTHRNFSDHLNEHFLVGTEIYHFSLLAFWKRFWFFDSFMEASLIWSKDTNL